LALAEVMERRMNQIMRWITGGCIALMLLPTQTGNAEDTPQSEPPQQASRKTEAYIAPYVLWTFPVDKDLTVGGSGVPTETFSGTNIKSSFGLGLKGGVYPSTTGGVIGLEGELFGHGGKLKTPPGSFPSADADLFVFNAMLNLLARYPGETLQPYIGAGIGVSVAQIRDMNLQGRFGTLTDKAGDAAFAYQFLAGMRAYVQRKIFLFGEYKYFGSSYDWKSENSSGGSGPTTSLNFRSHLAVAGLGVSF
jgi:opacity protein-like surface antigen